MTDLLKLIDIVKHYPQRRTILSARSPATVKAVDGISFSVGRGETLGLVGESGCGKSTTARLALRLQEPTAGTIVFDGDDITRIDTTSMRRLRRRMQIIFQDPYASLNPRMRVREILEEPMIIHGLGDGAERTKRINGLLGHVGLARYHAERYPHEFSGGQRQRIGIARALAVQPDLIVCDEPVSALDVSIQAQVTNLLKDLQSTFGLSYLFIAHDLSVVRYMADRIAVMYLGRILEIGPKTKIFSTPLHPYTRTLLATAPRPAPGRSVERTLLPGEPPSPVDPPKGCRFHPRCAMAIDLCRTSAPELRAMDRDHEVACHRAEEQRAAPFEIDTSPLSENARRRLTLYAARREARLAAAQASTP